MSNRYYPSTGLVSSDPYALSRIEQNRADCAAEQFELTATEFSRLTNAPRDRQELWLETRIAEFDENRRQIIGVYGSLPGGVAYEAFCADWRANREAHIARAWAAYDRAAMTYVPAVSL